MAVLWLFLIPVFAGLCCLIPKSAYWTGWIQTAGMVLLCGVTMSVVRVILHDEHLYALGQLIYLDALSGLMLVLISVISLLASIYSMGYFAHDGEGESLRIIKGYYGLLNLFILTMLIMVTASSMGILWIAIEATTLVSAFLVGFYNRQTSVEAAWKYIILCTVGIIFALIGIILFYAATMQAHGIAEQGLNWDYLFTLAPHLNPDLVKVAFIFILIGFGTKAGLAPLHTWLPDAHSEAPTPVSALLSSVLLKCGLYGIIRFGILTNLALGTPTANRLLLFFGLLSLAVAVPFILTQRNIKRLFAYSSLEHIGIIAVGLGFGTPLAVFGALFHFINHALVKALMFFSAGNLVQKFGTRRMAHIRCGFKLMPVTSTALLLGGLALTGMPPFSVFMSEFYIVTGGVRGHFWAESVCFILLLVIIFGGLIHHLVHMALGPEQPLLSAPEVALPMAGEVSQTNTFTLVALLTILLVLAWWIPAPLFQLLNASVEIVRGGSL